MKKKINIIAGAVSLALSIILSVILFSVSSLFIRGALGQVAFDISFEGLILMSVLSTSLTLLLTVVTVSNSIKTIIQGL